MKLPIVSIVPFFGEPMACACDARCEKAWGNNSRPKIQLGRDEDDYEFLADDELPDAPIDPGTSEGADSKPRSPEERMNKWCVRECERCVCVFYKYRNGPVELPDFSQRIANMGWRNKIRRKARS